MKAQAFSYLRSLPSIQSGTRPSSYIPGHPRKVGLGISWLHNQNPRQSERTPLLSQQLFCFQNRGDGAGRREQFLPHPAEPRKVEEGPNEIYFELNSREELRREQGLPPRAVINVTAFAASGLKASAGTFAAFRHSHSINIYTQAVPETMREANSRVVEMVSE